MAKKESTTSKKVEEKKDVSEDTGGFFNIFSWKDKIVGYFETRRKEAKYQKEENEEYHKTKQKLAEWNLKALDNSTASEELIKEALENYRQMSLELEEHEVRRMDYNYSVQKDKNNTLKTLVGWGAAGAIGLEWIRKNGDLTSLLNFIQQLSPNKGSDQLVEDIDTDTRTEYSSVRSRNKHKSA